MSLSSFFKKQSKKVDFDPSVHTRSKDSHHIKSNEAHNNHIKFLVTNYSKDDCLWLPGWSWQGFHRFLVSCLFHGSYVLPLFRGHEGIQRRATFVLLLVEFVNDDSNKKIESEETSKDDKSNKK